VSALGHLPGVHVLFLGDGDPGYNERLSRRARESGVHARVHFHDSVPLERLLGYTAEADVGVSLLGGDCENHRLALPNKVFEYVAAGVPVLASALPELDRVIREYGIGWTVDSSDPADIARGLAEALRRRDDPELGSNLERAARRLNWGEERAILESAYARLANGVVGER
jgi:glycosyltransferase involved in cell wall biosynthesis